MTVVERLKIDAEREDGDCVDGFSEKREEDVPESKVVGDVEEGTREVGFSVVEM